MCVCVCVVRGAGREGVGPCDSRCRGGGVVRKHCTLHSPVYRFIYSTYPLLLVLTHLYQYMQGALIEGQACVPRGCIRLIILITFQLFYFIFFTHNTNSQGVQIPLM